MAKLKLALEEKRDFFLYTTKVENLFINEYLPEAPGDYVKVYLLGLMCAQHDQLMDSRKISMLLDLSENEVEEAWIYWESKGLVRLRTERDEKNEEYRRVVFVSQIEALYGKSQESLSTSEESAAASEEVPYYMSIDDMDFDEVFRSKAIDKRLQSIYRKYQEVTGRTISRRETGKIEDAIRVYGIEPDIFEFSIDYCADLEKYSIDYIYKVAVRWTDEGCKSVDEVRKLLEKHSMRNSWYGQVFRALGFNRLPAPADREIMDRWFDEMKCSIGEVLEACSASAGLREPTLRYVNKVLENRRLEKGGVNTKAQTVSSAPSDRSAGAESENGGSQVSRKVLADYYEYLRNRSEQSRTDRIEEVKKKLPEMEALFREEKRLNEEMLSLRPGNEGMSGRSRLRAERQNLEAMKRELLNENGYGPDYLDRKYLCDICKDTGYTDEGMVCSCCRQRAVEAYEWVTGKDNR